MIASKSEIEKLIPHRQPFIMVDTLLAASTEEIVASFCIVESNILIQNGQFSDAGLIENIAQTCAAGFGYLDRDADTPPKLGFIGAINKLKVHRLPKINATITTRVKMLQQFENVVLVKGENFQGDAPLLECEMKIVIVSE